MAKKTTSKLKGGMATKAWRMVKDGLSYKEIGDNLGYTSTAVKLFAVRKYKERADDMWRQIVTSDGFCAIEGCTNTNINAHHILERGVYHHLRHELTNGISLCTGHHMFNSGLSPHCTGASFEAFIEWLRINRPVQHDFYQENKGITTGDVDYEADYNNLRQIFG